MYGSYIRNEREGVIGELADSKMNVAVNNVLQKCGLKNRNPMEKLHWLIPMLKESAWYLMIIINARDLFDNSKTQNVGVVIYAFNSYSKLKRSDYMSQNETNVLEKIINHVNGPGIKKKIKLPNNNNLIEICI